MATYIIYKDMMEQSTETANNEIIKRKKADQKVLTNILKKKLKKEQDNEQD